MAVMSALPFAIVSSNSRQLKISFALSVYFPFICLELLTPMNGPVNSRLAFSNPETFDFNSSNTSLACLLPSISANVSCSGSVGSTFITLVVFTMTSPSVSVSKKSISSLSNEIVPAVRAFFRVFTKPPIERRSDR